MGCGQPTVYPKLDEGPYWVGDIRFFFTWWNLLCVWKSWRQHYDVVHGLKSNCAESVKASNFPNCVVVADFWKDGKMLLTQEWVFNRIILGMHRWTMFRPLDWTRALASNPHKSEEPQPFSVAAPAYLVLQQQGGQCKIHSKQGSSHVYLCMFSWMSTLYLLCLSKGLSLLL